jgi:hypothetical protein
MQSTNELLAFLAISGSGVYSKVRLNGSLSILLTMGRETARQKGDPMKRLVMKLAMVLLAFALAGCATMGSNGHEGAEVKCPACGYEFNVPSDA